MRRLLIGLLLGLGGLVLPAPPAAGQEELANLFAPELGDVRVRSDYRITVVPEQPVEGQRTEFSLLQHDVNLSAPLWQRAGDEWSASLRVRAQDFDTRAVLPRTGEPFPDPLWNVRLGTTYRHRFDAGWMGGLDLAAGSPSDEPFASADELDVRATAFLRVPWRERHAWLFLLDYSNTRDFLGGLPVPGIGFSYRPSERLSAVIGTGFLSIQYRPAETVTVMASYAALRTVDLRVSYQIFRPLRLWASFDWTSERYLRAGRPDPDDRLFYYEKRVRVGATLGLARQLYVDVALGYTFDRFYFEGEDYDDRHENRIDVGEGPFVAARLGLRF